MSWVLNWAKPGRWVSFRRRAGGERAFRLADKTVEVIERDGENARLVEHRFASDQARDRFLTALAAAFHRKGFLRRESGKSPTAPATKEIADHTAPATRFAKATGKTKATSKKKPARTPKAVVTRPFVGSVADLVRRAKRAANLLATLGADVAHVKVAFARPASVRGLARLAAVTGPLPRSLAAIYRACDGFSVEYQLGDAGVVLEWLSTSAALAAWRSERKMERNVGPDYPPARKSILPVIAQYDGALVGVDLSRANGGEAPVVFLDRLADQPRPVASNAGRLLDELLAHAFTHPSIPDTAHKRVARIARALSRAARRDA